MSYNVPEIRKAEQQIFQEAEKGLLENVNRIIDTVPAYRSYLTEQKHKCENINDMRQFKGLPFSTKHSYAKAYPLQDRCFGGTLDDAHMVFSSSGSSGEPMFWPLRPDDEKMIPKMFDQLMKISLDYENNRTLIVICLGLGAWISGLQTHWALRQAAIENGGKYTVVTPGLDFKTTIDFVQTIGGSYDSVFLISYPAVIRTILEEGEKRGLDWNRWKMKIGLVGDSFPENWRINMENRFGIDPDKEPMAIWGGYGSADVGAIGIESPLSIAIRKIINGSPELCEKLFKSSNVPFLCRFDPRAIYIEPFEGELIYTSRKAAPLVRYRIHDSGGVIRFSDMIEALREHGTDISALPDDSVLYPAPLPFVYTYGKAQGDIVLAGANIYGAHIQEILQQDRYADKVSGRFFLSKKTDDMLNEELCIELELLSGVDASSINTEEWSNSLQSELKKINSEYYSVCTTAADESKCRPVITLLESGDSRFDAGKFKPAVSARGAAKD